MNIPFTIKDLRNAYLTNARTVSDVLLEIKDKIEQDSDMNIWIYTLSDAELEIYVQRLSTMDINDYPLWGIPFAIKDNIDLESIPTTAGCPEYAYTPSKNAFVIDLLIQAGAIPIGKTNLDQFATGLVGTRSPYGEVHNAWNPDLISGGSSSGSAVAVAREHVCFSLGTDTAGSGRVPALLNGLVGLKTALGAWSTRGVVPACASLDCISVFSHNIADSTLIDSIVRQEDEESPWSISLPRKQASLPKKILLPMTAPTFFGPYQKEYESAWYQFVDSLKKLNIPITYIDTTIFSQSASILYDGPWVAERYADLKWYLKKHENTLFPVTKEIICGAAKNELSADQLFDAIHFLQGAKKQVKKLLKDSVLILPTAGGTFSRKENRENPIETNSLMGLYTNHCNLLNLAAIALPTTPAAKNLPFGITVFSSNEEEHLAMGLCETLERNYVENPTVELLVCGLHMQGYPLSHQLLELDATYSYTTQTDSTYRMLNITTGCIHKPGLIYDPNHGTSFEVEIWNIPIKNIGLFLNQINAPLGLGKVSLSDKTQVIGFICEGYCSNLFDDISSFGGWRNFSNSR